LFSPNENDRAVCQRCGFLHRQPPTSDRIVGVRQFAVIGDAVRESCGCAADDPDCKCWQITRDGYSPEIDLNLQGAQRLRDMFAYRGDSSAEVRVHPTVAVAAATVVRRITTKTLAEAGPDVERYLYRLDNPMVFERGLQIETRTCDLDWCDRRFAYVPEVNEALGTITYLQRVFCSPHCSDFAARVRAIVDRHNAFEQTCGARAGSTAEVPAQLRSEIEWSRGQLRDEYRRLQRAWSAVRHEPLEGDERHFALIDNEDE
jgi:hypothetical protein